MKKGINFKSKKVSLLLILSLLLIFILTSCDVLDSNSDANKKVDVDAISKEDSNEEIKDAVPNKVPAPTEAPEPEYSEVTLAMVGDMLLHGKVHKSGEWPDGTYNYDHLFENIKEDIKAYDVAIVNQEVILGGVELGLSGYPTFNGAYEVADAIANAGFNVVLHATNHTLDKGKKGVFNTMNYWETNYPEIAVLGMNKSKEEQDNNIYVYEKDGIKIAFLNYTYGTNGIKPPSDMPYIVNYLDREKIEQDVKKANELADFVVVSPHWGIEYMHTPSEEQTDLAHFMADLGVDLVIGTHPHVVQPVEWIKTEKDNEMLIYYSLGNYINSTNSTGTKIINRYLGALAEVTIKKVEGEEAFISDYEAIPLITHKDSSGPGRITTYKAEDYTQELANKSEVKAQDPNFSLEEFTNIWNEVFPDFQY